MMSKTAAAVFATWLATALFVAPASAREVCEKKCYKAQTCPIVGSKCLDFDWCRDECREEGSTEPRPEAEKPAKPMLPGPGDAKPKTEI